METQIVKGLGETLVGALPGRAMSFIPKRSNLDSPTKLNVVDFVNLYISDMNLTFRSDSNAEDLEGSAGAGFYDRKKEALVECLKEKKLFKDTAAKLKADHEKAFESDNGEVGDRVT
ncbi:alpha-glucan water dikinase [Prunus yedoensis var. nudiflora]|uniref:Alpha-glucan water dikinase n=1 Tax=Prunus yedoensis var. nudiflora TaxID=2094558 RepID=A0A314Y4F4_PRUYE|nr:alpha-glucan water dikinase [Prunus yedoensis var. nudiflora]